MRFYQNTITDNENTEHKNTKNINTKNKNTKVRSQKKTILFGNFSQTSDPPPPTPYPKKNFSVYFGSCLLVFISVYYY